MILMNEESAAQIAFLKCEELSRVLIHASTSSHAARTRRPLELLSMHALEGRLVFATHRFTYRAIFHMAKTATLEIKAAYLLADVIAAQNVIRQNLEKVPRVCPRTRMDALRECLTANPVVTRALLASAANVSTETAGRWLQRLGWLGLVRRVTAGNIAIYFVIPLVVAVLRQLQLSQNLATDEATLLELAKEPVKIPMDEYRSGYAVAGDVSIQVRKRFR